MPIDEIINIFWITYIKYKGVFVNKLFMTWCCFQNCVDCPSALFANFELLPRTLLHLSFFVLLMILNSFINSAFLSISRLPSLSSSRTTITS